MSEKRGGMMEYCSNIVFLTQSIVNMGNHNEEIEIFKCLTKRKKQSREYRSLHSKSQQKYREQYQRLGEFFFFAHFIPINNNNKKNLDYNGNEKEDPTDI